MEDTKKSILFMVGATSLYSINDAFAKLVVTDYPIGNFVVIRSLLTLLMLAPFLRSKKRRKEVTSNLKLNIMRSLVAAVGTILMFWALRFMPLAECRLMLFTSPLFAFLLANPLLDEKLPMQAWSSILIGFLGASIVVLPGITTIDPLALIVLGSAFLLGLSNVISRMLTVKTSPYSLTLNYTVVTLILGSLFYDSKIAMPTLEQFTLIALMSVVNLAAQYALINAFKYGEVNKVAPLEYLELIYAMVLGFMIWGAVPNLNLLIGGALVLFSGILILYKKRVGSLSRSKRRSWTSKN
ncbi:MAG: DMT family transporter [Alphaproteobacteria bacterium]|nr:DMT family transporter [Alphaproteobacteria bacterium]